MKKIIRHVCVIGLLTSASLVGIAQALSTDTNGLQGTPTLSVSAPPTLIPSPPDVSAKAYVLMDVNSGTIIAQKNMNDQMPPASLTKLMTLLLVSEAIKNGTIKIDDPVLISNEAWQTGGSRMFVKVNTRVPVDLLLQGVIVDSGNDATMALAQYVGGSTDTFVDMMNQEAQALGLKNTHFTDPTGLPDPNHYSSAYDLSVIARTIWLNFPEFHDWYKEKWFEYNGIKQSNRNRLLWRYPYAVGMKTGHTDAAGYCLIGVAINNGMTLMAVVLNSPTDEARADNTVRLLSYGFRFYSSHLLTQAGSTLAQPRVWYGDKNTIPAGTLNDVTITAPQGQLDNAQMVVNVNSPLMAPIKKGQVIGSINVVSNGKTLSTYPLVALADDAKGGFFGRLFDGIAYHIHKLFGKLTIKPIVINVK